MYNFLFFSDVVVVVLIKSDGRQLGTTCLCLNGDALLHGTYDSKKNGGKRGEKRGRRASDLEFKRDSVKGLE